MAFIATCLMSSGAAKSGKPCERFTAPCLSASRVISRMTDSVKRLALCEICRCFEIAGVVMSGLENEFWQSVRMLSQIRGQFKQPAPGIGMLRVTHIGSGNEHRA